MKHKKAEDLLKRAGSEGMDIKEEETLDSWYIATAKEQAPVPSSQVERRLDNIWRRLPVNQKMRTRKIRLYWGVSTAAALFVALLILLPYKSAKKDPNIIPYVGKYKNDVIPGSEKAILVRSDGSELELSNENRAFSEQGSELSIGAGILSYNSQNKHPKEVFNMLKVPIGGQYKIKLEDGTQVWMNSGSTLRYPISFAGNYRRVELTGEAYFEVSKDEQRPFSVVTRNQEIQVLGTHFNVNAYENESGIRTALLEGSIRVMANRNEVLLKPGQQSFSRGDEIKVEQADLENEVAWKEGKFSFKGADIATVMRSLQRWYDLEVEYLGGPSQETYTGRISKKVTLSQVLKILEITGTRFKIDGRKISVYQ